MKLKILHISTRDTGGAGIAALRLHTSMQDHGIQSRFLCLDKTSFEKNVELFPKYYPRFYQRFFERLGLPMTHGQKNQRALRSVQSSINPEMYSFLRSDYQIHKHALVDWANVIIIHWVAGFLDWKSFVGHVPKNKKIFWYTHDFSIILGGFHTLFDANKFKNSAIAPIEASLKAEKRNYLAAFDQLEILANSQYSFDICVNDGYFAANKIHFVPLGIPANEFQPVEKEIAKKALGFNPTDFVLITAAAKLSSPRKGFDRLIKIIDHASKCVPNLKVVLLGGLDSGEQKSHPNFFYIGNVWHPKFKSILFSAGDLVISTSYEETFGQTIMEGYACATPALVFNNAALPELVRHGETGYIAETIEDASHYLVTLSKNRAHGLAMGKKAYQLFKTHYTSRQQVERFVALFEFN